MKEQEVVASNPLTEAKIASKIMVIRDVQVLLDRDIAEMYGVETKVFNQAVKRNIKRFPEAFRFQLNEDEALEVERSSRSQLGMRTNSWTQLEGASCILPKIKSPKLWKHFMI